MKRASIGEFEELVLLVTALLDGDAYGVTITNEIEVRTGRTVGFNTVHTTLQRLEEKGLIASEMGGATAERGGRRKRYFRITAYGSKTIQELRMMREQLWKEIPRHVLSLSKG